MLWALALLALQDAPLDRFEVEGSRRVFVSGLNAELEPSFDLSIRAVDKGGDTVESFGGKVEIAGIFKDADGKEPVGRTGAFEDGRLTIEGVYLSPGKGPVTVKHEETTGAWNPNVLPGFLVLLPPLIAILLAIVFRQVLVALFAAIWVGAVFMHGYNPFMALLYCFDTYLPAALADEGHVKIILFSLGLGGMVGVIAKGGGTRAIVESVSKWAKTRRSGMLTTWIMGILIFFDDYANCLLVGNTVRPLTDRQRISREKLSYLVDSTAAPIAAVFIISTWIGTEIGLIGDLEGVPKEEAYAWFISMIPYRFYAIFTLIFGFLIAFTMRDFGPMLKAEQRAIRTGELNRAGAEPLSDSDIVDIEPPEGRPLLWYNAAVPIFSVLAFVIGGLFLEGYFKPDRGEGLRGIIGAADSYNVLLWGAFGGSLVAIFMVLGTRALRLGETMKAWVGGARSMVMAVLILTLAWTLGSICEEQLLIGNWILSHVTPSPHWLPLIVFLFAALIALSTGTSWGTMTIMIPIAGPVVFGATAGLDPETALSIQYATLAAVLTGAVYGDHCSPISDTTIMSSMAAAADHMDHVRTQFVYGTVCAGVAAVVGYIPAGFGLPPWISILLGTGVLMGVLFYFGRRADAQSTEPTPEG